MPDAVARRGLSAYKIRLEPRLDEPPAWYSFLLSLAAIFVALFLGGIVIGAAGGDPIRSYVHIANASFGSLGVLSDTIVKATPILLAALACAIAFLKSPSSPTTEAVRPRRAPRRPVAP